MSNLRSNFWTLIVTAGPLLACDGPNHGPPPATPGSQTTITSSQKYADMAVVDRLSGARCERERDCKNVGPGAKYASHGVCMDQIRGNIGNDLNPNNCPGGLDREAIDRCMVAIKSEECGHPFDTLARYEKCRTGALCMK